MNIKKLTAKASKANPSAEEVGNKTWKHLRPIFLQLVEKGFSYKGATEWLVDEGAIPDDEESSDRACRSLAQYYRKYHHRDNRAQ